MFAKFLNARQKLGYSKLSNKRAEQNVWREEFVKICRRLKWMDGWHISLTVTKREKDAAT